jgi:hypothetical protein
MVYLSERGTARRFNVFPATMLLMWRAPGAKGPVAQQAANTIEIDNFNQNDASNGYVSVKYNLLGGKGRLRAKVYDSAKPDSAAYFTSSTPEVQSGRGLMLVEVQVDAEAKSPAGVIHADTVEVELLDGERVIARSRKEAAMIWARPQ